MFFPIFEPPGSERKQDDETDLSTKDSSTTARTRLSPPNGNCRRPRSAETPPPARPPQIDCIDEQPRQANSLVKTIAYHDAGGGKS